MLSCIVGSKGSAREQHLALHRDRLRRQVDDAPEAGLAAEGEDLVAGGRLPREVAVAEGVLADQVGVDYFGIGEHHREEFAVSSPDVVLAAIAGQTERIRLGTGVTVLSSDDPVRVYERFATLDAVSGGRAEVQLGRGSFTESFPLFGYSLEDYEDLFADRQVQAIDAVRWIENDTLGRVPMANICGQRPPATGDRLTHSPHVGEHTREVLGELGYSASEINRLSGAGVVACYGA